MLWMLSQAGTFFGKTVITLSVVLAVFVMLPTPATSFATGTTTRETSTSGITSISNSVSLKKPQGLFAASSLSYSKATVAAVSSLPSSSTSASLLDLERAASMPSSSIFTWGHVMKYSSVLYEEDVVVKGPIVLNVKYPQIENANSYTIVGIQAYDNANVLNPDYTNGNLTLQVYPVKGGIGFNSTVIRFLLVTDHELHYKLIIHGVDV